LRILAGQTVIESATISFPGVKAETRFLVQWVTETDKVVGTTDVFVYPNDILKELKTLAGDEPVGIFDSDNRLKPLLKELSVEFSDLEDSGIASFGGRLAIVDAFSQKATMPEDLAQRIKTAAGKGPGVVWLQQPGKRSNKLRPSFYTVATGKGTIVVAQANLVTKLADDPQAQLNLVQLCRLAVRPEPLLSK